MVWIWILCNKKSYRFMTVKELFDVLIQVFKNAYSVRVYIIAVHSLISVENLSSACVNSLEFAEVSFFSSVPLCDCNNAAPMPTFEASLIA